MILKSAMNFTRACAADHKSRVLTLGGLEAITYGLEKHSLLPMANEWGCRALGLLTSGNGVG